MEQNPFTNDRREMQRAAQRYAQTAADQGRSMANAAGARQAGTFASDGTWQPFGLLGITTFDTPFRLGG